MTYEDARARMTQLVADLAPLEVAWEVWEWGRLEFDGIQHVRRDGSVIVVTDDSSDYVVERWLVGFYTAAQFADADSDAQATYVYCDSTPAVLLAIIDEGQARDSGARYRLTGESDAAYAERCLRNGTLEP